MMITFTRSLLKYLLVITIVTIAFQNHANAGGFPVRPGRLLISPSVSYFFANKQWDSTGTKKPFDGNGKFSSYSVSLYSEYGISRRLAAVALLPYVSNTFQTNGQKFPTAGITDLEVGLKYYLANINYIYYFSVQATGIAPLYTDPNLGYKEEGAEIKLSFAGSGEVFNRNYFFDVDNGVRQYFGTAGPFQDRYSGTFGLTLDKRFKEQISLSVSGFYSKSNFTDFNDHNPYTNKNFSFTQASISYGHAFSKELTLFLTAGQFLIGRNTGAGSSAQVSFVYRIGGI